MENVDMNKPVAYINEEDGLVCAKCYKPFKELTDEEINEIVWQQNILLGNDALKKFAKAILRKAQEK